MQKLLLVALVFLVLGAAVVMAATQFVRDPFGANLKDFVTLAGMGLTFVAALLTGVISVFNMLTQLGTARELELLKPLLALEYPAFKDLNNAALTYYDVFSRLDTGNYDPQLAEAAEVEMKKSYGVLWFMSQKYQDAWWEYWTQARNMKETLGKEVNNRSFNQKEYWSKRSGDGARLYTLLESLREATPRRKHSDMDSPTNTPTPAHVSAAILLIRIASGLVFLYHGSAILFGAFGGPGLAGFSAFTHAPTIVGFLVGLAQLTGGLAILSGFFIRIGAACIIIVMLGAILLVHLSHGFDISKGGMEYAFTQLLIAIALLITGAGNYSLTSRLPEKLRKL